MYQSTTPVPLLLAAGTAIAALVLASCSSGDAAHLPSPGQTRTSESSATVAEIAPPAPETVEPLGTVDCPGIVREPTQLEASLLVEAGPHSGDAFDVETVLGILRTKNFQTAEEWADQIRSLIQGDYAEAVCSTINFHAEIGAGEAAPQETADPASLPASDHFGLVLDASGSMAADSGVGTRMDAAKAALADFVDELPADATVSVRIYGHEGNNSEAGKAESCAASEVVYQGSADSAALEKGIATVEPVGWTPLAKAITDSATDIPANSIGAIVYVVTDGIETCGGDPTKAAAALAASGLEPVINVIGFGTGDSDVAELEAMAQAGGGAFTRVDTQEELGGYWDSEHLRMASAWRKWELQELSRIRAEGAEHAGRARELQHALGDELAAEKDNTEVLLGLLESEGLVTGPVLKDLYWSLRDHRTAINNYAFDTGNANWSAAKHRESEAGTKIYDQSSGKWNEYFAKHLEER